MEEIFAEMDRITEKFYNEVDQLTEKLQPKQEPYMEMSVKIPNVLKDQREYLDSALGTYEQDKLEQEIAYYRRAVQRWVYTVDERERFEKLPQLLPRARGFGIHNR